MTEKLVIHKETTTTVQVVRKEDGDSAPAVVSMPVFYHEGEVTMGMISVQDTEQNLTATVVFLDEHGHETSPHEAPEWSSDNEEVATVSQSEDGMSASVALTGTPGAAVIAVDTTNEAGDLIHSQGTITVLPGDVVSGDVEFQTETPTGGDEAGNAEAPPADETGV